MLRVVGMRRGMPLRGRSRRGRLPRSTAAVVVGVDEGRGVQLAQPDALIPACGQGRAGMGRGPGGGRRGRVGGGGRGRPGLGLGWPSSGPFCGPVGGLVFFEYFIFYFVEFHCGERRVEMIGNNDKISRLADGGSVVRFDTKVKWRRRRADEKRPRAGSGVERRAQGSDKRQPQCRIG